MAPEPERPVPGCGVRRLRRLQLLRYYPGDSFLHRLDPRTKLLALAVVSIASFLFSALLVMVLLFAFGLALAIISGIGKKFLAALSLVLPFFVMVVILDSLFTKTVGGVVYYSATIGFLHPQVTQAGIIVALAMGFRLLSLCGISLLFLMTTSQDDFIRSLRGIKIPSALNFSLGYALRSTTSLADDTAQIMDAQRSRGLELDTGNLVKNRNKLTALFVPVTVSMLKRSKNTSDAMLARGYRQSLPLSRYKPPVFGNRDIVMGCLLVALLFLLIGVNRYFPV
jgi:ABC-type cobalt transport system, permease component CbiQ and related transporters